MELTNKHMDLQKNLKSQIGGKLNNIQFDNKWDGNDLV